jgi:hypothetical protein
LILVSGATGNVAGHFERPRGPALPPERFGLAASADRVRSLGEVLGRELRFEGQSDVDAREEMLASMPAKYVDGFFSFFADGELDESEVRDAVERVTGRHPRSFEQWASAGAAFR